MSRLYELFTSFIVATRQIRNMPDMSSKKNAEQDKKMCGLWHSHTEISEYNKFGKCACLSCCGMDCHNCITYISLVEERFEQDFFAQTRCQKCLQHTR